MPEVYPARIWTRARWKEKRDDKKFAVGPNAVMSVNMGDLLDKFEAANKVSVVEGQKAALKLQKGMTKYLAGVKKKHKAWHDHIERFLGDALDSYLKDAQSILDAIPKYNTFRAAASEQVSEGMRQLLENEKSGNTGGFKPTNMKAAGKALSDLLTCAQRMVYVHDGVSKEVCKKLDRAVYAVDGAGEWHKKMVMALVDQLNQLPVKI